MSACTFTLPFSGSPEVILNKAKAAIEKQGGTFNGDEKAGAFHLSVMNNTIAGSYTISGHELTMIITDKPFFVPCSTIESMLKSKLV